MNRFLLIISAYTPSFLLVLSLLLPVILPAQTPYPVANWLETYRLGGDFQPVALLHANEDRATAPSVVEYATMLALDHTNLENLLSTAPATISLTIPNVHGDNFELELAKVSILTPEFSVGTLGNNAHDNVAVSPGVHYRGIIRGKPQSVVAVSIFQDELMAMISDENGNYQVGKMADGTENYILYRSADLRATNPFHCFTDDDLTAPDSAPSEVGERGIGCKTVGIYLECDYKLYVDKGSSVSNVTNYMTGLFNQISALYAAENVGIAISQIYVWSTTDPYASLSSTSAVLNAFQSTRGTNFTGNLAHFVSGRNLGGGVAYVDVICTKSYAFGVSAINATYQNVPIYSWTVEVMTHELGHNLGSWHTHSCNWTGGALDNCYTAEGSCGPGPTPVGGGTIMSYCHLSGVGINFNNGFGTQPGNKIRDKVLNASCLSATGALPISLATSNLTGASVTLTWGAVTGATQYTVQYKTSSSGTWITAGTTVAATYNLSGLVNNTTYNWQVKTDCSGYSATANFTTTTTGGGGGTGGGGTCSAPISLNIVAVTASSAVLSWGVVTGATQYTLQYKPNTATAWTTAGNTYSNSFNLAGLMAGTIYNWKVKANCSGYSTTLNFTTTSNGGGGGGGSTCAAPINLTNSNITSSSAQISWTAVPGATTYTVQLRLASATTYLTLGTVAGTAANITGFSPGTAYVWRIKANCSNYSPPKSLVTANSPWNGRRPTGNLPNITLSENSAVSVYPNPANSVLNLHLGTPVTPETEVWITGSTGQLVMRRRWTTDETPIDISSLTTGLYFLTVMQDGRRVATEKFVKAL